jgi:hypothetical protein
VTAARNHHPRKTARSAKPQYWSGNVTRSSNALDLEQKVFSRKRPEEIARSLKRSAEASHRRKGSPYQSAMSMLTFFINRAGKSLTDARRRILERAKEELRRLYGQPQLRPAQATHRAHGGHSRAGHERRR